MAHCQAHICHCLGRIRNLRRASSLTIARDRRRSVEEFAGDVISLALGLSKLSIRSGDVVTIAALNCDFYMEWFLAITYVGGIVAPLNYRWSFEEAKWAMEVVSPVMLVVDESCSSWVLALQDGNLVLSLRLYAFIGDYSSAQIVEAVLSQHSGVFKAVVVGIPDPRLSEKVILLVSPLGRIGDGLMKSFGILKE